MPTERQPARARARLGAIGLCIVALLGACGGDDDTEDASGAEATSTTSADAGSDTTATAAVEPADGTDGSDGGATDLRLADDPIEMWLPFGDGFAEDVLPLTEACQDRTGVAIEPVGVEVDYTEMQLKLAVDVLADAGPDIAVQGLNQVIAMGSADFTVPLDEYVDGSDVLDPADMPFLEVGRIGDEQVIVPWIISVPVVFVNQDLLTEAGLDPDTVPGTWADVEEISAAVAASGPDRYGMSFGIQEGYIPLTYLLSAGGGLIDDELRPAFTDDAAAAAIGHWHDLYQQDLAFPGDQDQSREAFEQGKVAMLVWSSSAIDGVAERADFAWTAHPFPAADDSTEVRVPAGGNGLALLAQEDRRDDAFAVLECLTSPEIDLMRVELLGNLPTHAANAESLSEQFDAPPWSAAWAQADLVDRWYSFPGDDSSRLTRIFTERWIEAAQRSDDPMAVLEGASDEMSDILG
ncbi:MAG: extracellular solute-binding protein [Actinomycetota bacterium]|nr:extracellular solute-binding protein [Actinomycetota bacterium]